MVQVSLQLGTLCLILTAASTFCFGHFLGSPLCCESPMHIQKPVNHARFCPIDLTHAGLPRSSSGRNSETSWADLVLGLCYASASTSDSSCPLWHCKECAWTLGILTCGHSKPIPGHPGDAHTPLPTHTMQCELSFFMRFLQRGSVGRMTHKSAK